MNDELFERVRALVAEETRARIEEIRPDTRVEDDLGCTGEDAAELMAAYARAFAVDMTGFRFERHFGPEVGATPLSLVVGVMSWLAGRSSGSSAEPITIARLVEAAARRQWVDTSAQQPNDR